MLGMAHFRGEMFCIKIRLPRNTIRNQLWVTLSRPYVRILSSKAARLTTCNDARVVPTRDGREPRAWETGQMNSTIYIGLDVHKTTVSVAVAEGGRAGENSPFGRL